MPTLSLKSNVLSRFQRNVLLITFCFVTLLTSPRNVSLAETRWKDLTSQTAIIEVQASFTNKDYVSPTELITLRLSRALQTSEGTLGVFIGDTDVTTLFESNAQRLRYSPKALRLPIGENPLIVFLISPAGEWTEITRFKLRVSDGEASGTAVPQNGHWFGLERLELEPSLSVNVKAQAAVLYFPETERPERINSLDFAFQGSLQSKFTRNTFSNQNQFDFVGTSVQKEALRFGDESNDAPQIDLASYLLQFQVKKVKVLLGQHSYGTNRYLINGFSSRGLSLTVPLKSNVDVSFNAVNGTSVVGWNNFTGLEKHNHRIFSGTLNYEVFSEHPGWLRFEAGLLRASRQPLNNYNQRNLTDVESSNGVGVRVVASDKNERLRLEAGFGRSRFGNPVDPLLDQGFSVVPVQETSRNAQYLDVSFQFLKDANIGSRKANLGFTFRHNRVDPLFRSIAVFAQADKLENEFELTGNVGDITATVGHNRLNDNLNDVPSILKTLTRRSGFNLGVPLASLWGTKTGGKWLPRLSYNYERLHAFGAFLPVNSDFAISHVPDQASTSHSFNAEWQRETLRFGYRFNQSVQDNRQPGRERADFKTLVNSFTMGVTPQRRLEMNFDLSSERSSNLEIARFDQTWRGSISASFQTTKKSTLAATISSAFAGDTLNLTNSRNADLDVQWSWRFGVEKDRYRKVQGQFFIRYANRYTRATDNIFLFRNLTKLQTMSAGLTFTFF